MKKVFAIFLAVTLALLVVSCSSKPEEVIEEKAKEQEVEEIIEEIKSNFANSKVGDIIEFGLYNWRILEITDGKALIISEELLGERQYSEVDINYWEYSEIRAYLNNEFLQDNFTEDERLKICEKNIVTDNNPWCIEVRGGNDTRDKVYILSLREVVEYFGDSGKLDIIPDDFDIEGFDDQYNENRIGKTKEGNERGWWLRTPGDRMSYVSLIDYQGYVDVFGTHMAGRYCIRPVMWIKLDGEAKEEDHDPIITREPITYVTNNKTFAFDVPYSLDIIPQEHSGNGDRYLIKSYRPKWSINIYEQTTTGGYNYDKAKSVLAEIGYDVKPITIGGKEAVYCLHDDYTNEVFIDIQFPNPSSDNKNAMYGSIWIFATPIEGYTTEDYLEIPELKIILDSIRVPQDN